MLREDFLQQSSFHEVDRFCPLDKSYGILNAIIGFHLLAEKALAAEIPLETVTALPVVEEIARAKELPLESAPGALRDLAERIRAAFEGLLQKEAA
jgi:V/A-type H+-transporting ATPase subunit A